VAPLFDQIDDPIGRVTADSAYDGAPTYQTIAAYGDGIEVVIPSHSTAVPSCDQGLPTQRGRHLALIAEQDRLSWQVATDYGQHSLIEMTMGRYKVLIGPWLRARGFAAQQTEATIGVAVLNRMRAAGPPKSARVQRVIDSSSVLGLPQPPSAKCTNATQLRERGLLNRHCAPRTTSLTNFFKGAICKNFSRSR